MALAETLEDALLNWVFGTAFPPPPSQLWLSLHSDEEPSAGNEIVTWSGGSRLRVSGPDFAAATAAPTGGRRRLNARALMLGSSPSSQAPRSFALWDAATGGTILITGDVAPDATVNAGDPPVFLTGDLAIEVR